MILEARDCRIQWGARATLKMPGRCKRRLGCLFWSRDKRSAQREQAPRQRAFPPEAESRGEMEAKMFVNVAMSLDSIKRRSVYVSQTLQEFGFVDDVIVDPKFGVLAVVCHSSVHGTWAFSYPSVRFTADGIWVDEREKRSPRAFLRLGRSYQDLIGAQVVEPDGTVRGRIKDVALADTSTGEIAYDVSPPGLGGLWASTTRYWASTDVVADEQKRIVVVAENLHTPTESIDLRKAA